MRVLIACEYSGVVRRAFRNKGHDAWSCDLLPSEDNSEFHLIGDAIKCAYFGLFENNWKSDWDLMIAHPPCTHLCVSGARWWKDKQEEQISALQFVRDLMNAPVKKKAIENPISKISTAIRKPDQIIQPWMFGHGETKATCLWLDDLPALIPTNIVDGRENRIHKMPPSANRWKERSRTYTGIAKAMAEQWE